VDSNAIGQPNAVNPSQTNALSGFSGGSLGMPDTREGYSFCLRSRPGDAPQTSLYRTDRSVAYMQAQYFFSAADTFQNAGWVPVRLTCNKGEFTFQWGGTVGAYANAFVFTVPSGTDFGTQYQAYEKAWFGISGATGSYTENHGIRNARLEAAIPPSLKQPPVIQSISRSSGQVDIAWLGIAGAKYQVQYATQLNQIEWLNSSDAVTSATTRFSAVDANAADA
jgi:hypothetical protein